jgi:hypothetical protein
VRKFISYDFLKEMLLQPELFELRQVLAIPKEDIEARHEYMLSGKSKYHYNKYR